ncbi:MAG: helicase-related protein, partial [Pontimonas sp.]
IVVGTHALLSNSTQFHDLGLVVVDEQHRFGVTQRDVLRHKGSNPHVLVLTATPIPRTVAMTVFGDVDISTIRGVPAGRQPVTTHVVALAENPGWFSRVWQRADEEIEAGHRVFVVAPAIDQSGLTEGVDDGGGYPERVGGEDGDEPEGDTPRPLTAVLELAATLTEHELLGHRKIGVVHGRLDSKEKEEVMAAFYSGGVELLVATTVIEVGVDVPHATMMVVMDADRFGMSQLHQLRGRIGRGDLPGVCLMVTHQPAESMARQRLDAVASTTDGFELARIDMQLRREGDVLGSNQSGGRSGLKLVRVSVDGELIESARADAKAILAVSPDLADYSGLQGALSQRLAEIDAEYLDRS